MKTEYKIHSIELLTIAVIAVTIAAAYHNPLLSRYMPHWPGVTDASGTNVATNEVGIVDGTNTTSFVFGGTDNAPNNSGFGGNGASIVIDTVNHRLFAADVGASRVLVFNLDGSNHLIDRFADYVLGQSDFRGQNPGTSNHQFDTPIALAYDSGHNRLFVADNHNSRVMVFDLAGGISNNMAATYELGQADGNTNLNFFDDADGGIFAQNTLYFPYELDYDAADDWLFVSDDGNARVMIFDLSGGISNAMNAAHEEGQANFSTVNPASTNNRISGTRGVAYDSTAKRMFVSDGSANRVLMWDFSGGITDGVAAANVIGQLLLNNSTCPGPPYTIKQVCGPNRLTYDHAHERLFVAQEATNRISVFDVTGVTNNEDAINQLGAGTDWTSPQSGLTQSLTSGLGGFGMGYDSGNQLLYAADLNNNRVMVFDVNSISDGEPAVDALGELDEFGNPLYTYSGAYNAPSAQGLSIPAGVAMDSVHHRLFVADNGNSRVMVYNLNSSNQLVDHTADYVLGQPDVHANTGGTSATIMKSPQGLFYDSAGDQLFVADAGNNRVLVYDTASISNGEAAVHVIGHLLFSDGGSGSGAAAFGFPSDVAYDSTGKRLFVADYSNNRVQVFDTTLGISDGMSAARSLGGAGISQSLMNNPWGLAFDSAGHRLFVSDSTNNRVMVFDVSGAITNGMNAAFELGQHDGNSNANYFDDAGAATSQLGMSSPLGISYDSVDQQLLVVDDGNNRVLSFDLSGGITNGMNALDVYGQSSFLAAGTGLTNAKFNAPIFSAYDPSNAMVWVSDNTNNRVVAFPISGATPPTPTPTPTPTSTATPPPASGGGGIAPVSVTFTPQGIVINEQAQKTDSRNVMVSLQGAAGPSFNGTVTVLVSNDPNFSTFIPFRYTITGLGANGAPKLGEAWPHVVPWDLCWNLPTKKTCDPGTQTVYARFYINVAVPSPALTPLVTSAP